MDYPIMDGGERIGTLTARQDGLYTLFEARLPRREGLTRLFLCGGGECRCLGLMEPRADGLVLRRRLSRAQIPKRPAYAALSPRTPAPRAPEEADAWTARPDGTLVDAARRLLAIPACLRRTDGRLQIRSIRGKEYIVFRF